MFARPYYYGFYETLIQMFLVSLVSSMTLNVYLAASPLFLKSPFQRHLFCFETQISCRRTGPEKDRSNSRWNLRFFHKKILLILLRISLYKLVEV